MLVVNAIVMSLAAVPAYLLARLFVSRRSSLLVAALTVLVPSLSYTGAVLTENVCYPLFLFAVLAHRGERCGDRPSGAQAVVLRVALGSLALTQSRGSRSSAGYAGAVLTYALTTARGRDEPVRAALRPTALAAVPLALGSVIASAVRGRRRLRMAGPAVGERRRVQGAECPSGSRSSSWASCCTWRSLPQSRRRSWWATGFRDAQTSAVRLFAAVALPTFVSMLLSVAFVSASFDVDRIGNLNERYVFHVVPLTFVGLALWIERGLPRPRPWAWVALGVACLRRRRSCRSTGSTTTPVSRRWLCSRGSALSLSPVGGAIAVGAVTLGCGGIWITCGPRSTGRLWALVGVWMALLGLFAVESNRVSASKTAAAFAGRSATWVDDALPAGRGRHGRLGREPGAAGTAGLVLLLADGHRVLQSRASATSTDSGPATLYEDILPTVPARVGSDRTLIDSRGRALAAEYALVTCRTPIEGRVVAQAPRGAFGSCTSTARFDFRLRRAARGSAVGVSPQPDRARTAIDVSRRRPPGFLAP